MDREKLEKIAKAQTGTGATPPTPQSSPLFRIIAFFSHLQLGYFSHDGRHSQTAVRVFVFLEGLTAIGIIAITAYLVQLPLLFPPPRTFSVHPVSHTHEPPGLTPIRIDGTHHGPGYRPGHVLPVCRSLP